MMWFTIESYQNLVSLGQLEKLGTTQALSVFLVTVTTIIELPLRPTR